MLLATDLAFANTGWILAESKKVWKCGVITTEPPKKKNKLRSDSDAHRIQILSRSLDEIITSNSVKGIVSEMPASSQNARACKTLGFSVGVLVSIATIYGIPIEWYQPLDVKKALCGSKFANKRDMINGAVWLLGGEVKEKPTSQGTRRSCLMCGEWFPYSKAEHIADAVGVYLAAQNDNVALMFG